MRYHSEGTENMSTAPSNEVATATYEQAKPPFLRRVRIRGYKSIAFCDVTLEPLTILVGRNASGKSNFIDALAFLHDAFEEGLAVAIKRRGGQGRIISRDAEEQEFSIEIEATTPWLDSNSWTVNYQIKVSVPERRPPQIVHERLRMVHEGMNTRIGFVRDNGQVLSDNLGASDLELKEPTTDRPFLGDYPFTPVVELVHQLSGIRTYNFHPEAIRPPQIPNPGWPLERDGSNLASVIETTRENDERTIERVGRYLSVITESVELLGVAKVFDHETVRFRVARDGQPLEFNAASMSDGTLRALAALVAAFQIVLPHGSPSLVAIEEPETSLHPAAIGALVDALDEATLRTQIVLTTHDTEMLDNPTIRPENIRVVQLVDGKTVIGPVDEASVEIVRRNLDTLGGLERQNQLEPDLDDQERQRALSRNGQELPE